MSKFKKFAVAGVAALGLLSMQAAPASAHAPGAGVFIGEATTTPGLWYPVAPACLPTLCPSGNGTWTIGVSGVPPFVGVGASTASGGQGFVTTPTVLSGNLHANLNNAGIGAFCGVSGGSGGSGSIRIGSVTQGVQDVEWITSAASLIVATGSTTDDAADGDDELLAVVSAIPDPTAGSCAAGTATKFVVAGLAVFIP